LKRDSYKCAKCGASPSNDHTVELEVDHIHPRRERRRKLPGESPSTVPQRQPREERPMKNQTFVLSDSQLDVKSADCHTRGPTRKGRTLRAMVYNGDAL
jgi:5-methylcytosine-specific restriction endonuclease McrA